MRVLVVDDETELRSLARVMFEREDIEVTEAADGASAVQAVKSGGCDVVLLDSDLPDMPGAEVLVLLRDIDPSIRCVVLTAEATDLAGARKLIQGADAYFIKPFSVRDVVASVLQLGSTD